MLRKDTLYMMKSDWEPKVPTSAVIEKQVSKTSGKLAGSVRLAKMKFSLKKAFSDSYENR